LALILENFNVRKKEKAKDVKILFEIAGTPYTVVLIQFGKL